MSEHADQNATKLPTPRLSLRGISHTFGPREVLANVQLDIAARQCVALIGPSGCGKTTLVHLCAGLLSVQTGQMHNTFARSALMFQQPLLLPWLSVADNIALSLHAHPLSRTQQHARAAHMAASLGLDALALRQFPHQLSGGMQSRAALARALVAEPDLLLLDEPFAALDIGLKAHMHALVQQSRRERALATLLITHDVAEAVTLADTILVMAAHPGRMVWRLDIPDHIQRTPQWTLQQTAALLAQPLVRQAFGLPDLPTAAEQAACSPIHPGQPLHSAPLLPSERGC